MVLRNPRLLLSCATVRSIVIGTAGHIDHGKTALVRALTGIDTDRLPEEKDRGITIELGFAPLTLPSGTHAGVVDVPGHERFVRTMVAGAGGIDLALLVVAANEGVMPQTREHLAICRLLGIRAGVVALTKVDAVEPDMVELAREDVASLVAGTFLEGAPIVPVSAVAGLGLEELRTALDQVAATVAARDATGPARLPIDRAFTVKGFGVVVTGTLVSGRLEVGQSAVLLPSGEKGKIRGLQIHGQTVPRTEAGTRLAVNLAGIETEAVERWQWLVKEGELEPTREIDARVELLGGCKRSLQRRARVSVHVGTATSLATLVLLEADELAPGTDALCRLRLDSPLVVLQGDRFILRGDTALAPFGGTIGGGTVLRPLAGRYRRRADAAERARLVETATGPDKAAAEVRWAGPRGLSPDDLRRRVAPDPAGALAGAKKAGTVLEVEPGRLVHTATIAALEELALTLIGAHHQARPLEPGMGREELRTRLHGGAVSPRLFQRVLDQLARRGVVAEREFVRLSTHRPRDEGRGSELAEKVGAALAGGGLQPPRVKELATVVGATERDTIAALKILGTSARAVRVSDELYFDGAAIEDLRKRLTEFLEQKGSISAQEWKDLTGASRKFTIPLAEHFDSQKLTMRVGETRVLRRKA